MKINRFKVTFILLSTFASVALSGCSNEDNIESQPQEGMAKISFKINEKDYEPGVDVAGTRAAAPTKPELQDLGNGWMAEVSLEPDTTHAKEAKAAEAKTRAIYGPAHYTIQAYQGGVKKGELKGTFQGSTFTPDAGTAESIFLPHGTYDFVCFNDQVSANGTQFTVNRADAGTARFTVQRGVVINQDPKQYVAFEMKHAGAYVTMNLALVNCSVQLFGTSEMIYTFSGMANKARSVNPTDHIKYFWTSNSNSIPETMIYDFATNTYSYPTMGNYSYTDEGVWGQVYTQGKTNIWTSSMPTGRDSFLPTTDCANLKFTITDGSLYDRSLTGMIKIPAHKQLEANKAYLLVVRLLMTKPQYLFSDGTIGDLDKNVGKTPIGVLPRPGGFYAIALNDVKNSYGSSLYTQWSNATTQESSKVYTNYKDLFMNGASNAHGSGISAVQAAESYRSQVSIPSSTTTIGGWDVSNLFNFMWMGVSFAGLPEGKSTSSYYYSVDDFNYLTPAGASTTGFTPGPSWINFPSMNMTRFNKAFTDAGGTAPEGRYWLDTEVNDGGQAKQVVIDISSSGYRLDFASKQSGAKIRPVIRLNR